MSLKQACGCPSPGGSIRFWHATMGLHTHTIAGGVAPVGESGYLPMRKKYVIIIVGT